MAFFRGTSLEQDARFSNTDAKLIKTQEFAPILSKSINLNKVQMKVITPWITSRIYELANCEDEVIPNYAIEMLQQPPPVNPREMQLYLTGFIGKDNSYKFMEELWTHLVSASESKTGIPEAFLQKEKERIERERREQEQIRNQIHQRSRRYREDDNDDHDDYNHRSSSSSNSSISHYNRRRDRDEYYQPYHHTHGSRYKPYYDRYQGEYNTSRRSYDYRGPPSYQHHNDDRRYRRRSRTPPSTTTTSNNTNAVNSTTTTTTTAIVNNLPTPGNNSVRSDDHPLTTQIHPSQEPSQDNKDQ